MELTFELAQLSARHIAEEGLTYWQAKRKAAKQCGVGEHNTAMPSNEAIEQALREYLNEFQADTQPAELRRMRELAINWLENLCALDSTNGLNDPCKALAVGAVVNGTANEHSAVHIQVFTDEFKALEMALLDAGIELEFTEKKLDGTMYPVLVAQDDGIPIALTVMPRQRYVAPKDVAQPNAAQTATARQLKTLSQTANNTIKSFDSR
jgi:hypothetical protein